MWTIWCMVLYFFGARAEINQPSILVLKEDENATLSCSQNDNHNYMSWYLQQPGKGLQLIYYSVGENQENKGDIHTGYEAKRLTKQVFRLDIISVKKNHSAIYFCASSFVARTEGVGTDEISTSNGSTYSLTSRLRISAQEWFNPLNRFECIADFFKNGTQQSIQKIIYGDTGCDIFKENYQRSATAGKFVYIMLIFKSILYGIFVMGMMLWYKKMY
nr:T cell receptor beta [Gallus gallus]